MPAPLLKIGRSFEASCAGIRNYRFLLWPPTLNILFRMRKVVFSSNSISTLLKYSLTYDWAELTSQILVVIIIKYKTNGTNTMVD